MHIFILGALVLAGCQPLQTTPGSFAETLAGAETDAAEMPGTQQPTALVLTPFPTRPAYAPGELVDYVAQTGDTLEVLAVHFNTSVEEILQANSFIPRDASTMPPGMPMKIPIYYAPFWGSPNQIIPDSLFINGPAQVGFDIDAFVAERPGWLREQVVFAGGENRSGGQVVALVAKNFSISPRLLLAILEYQTGALSNPQPPPEMGNTAYEYWLGIRDLRYRGLYLQLVRAADLLNNGYYGWRSGALVTFDLLNDRTERPDPWQNAASVAIQQYYAALLQPDAYALAIGADGLGRTYQNLFGDPFTDPAAVAHIPGSLQQPVFALPFRPGIAWAYTGGPHTAWGDGHPLAAIDFAPGAETGGCYVSPESATAVADGVVARSETGIVVLDLDGDGDERTGWTVFYLHVATTGRAAVGDILRQGDHLGYPSCEGGRSTGTHIHIARRYNGEWILAGGPLAFNLEGWVVQNGAAQYQGFLVREGVILRACDCADQYSQLTAQGIQP